jgi:hypothetical protein
MAWIKLTQLDGATVYVSGDQIVRVRPPIAEAPSANAVVDFTNGQVQAVLETIPQVVALLSGRGDSAGKSSGGDDRLV